MLTLWNLPMVSYSPPKESFFSLPQTTRSSYLCLWSDSFSSELFDRRVVINCAFNLKSIWPKYLFTPHLNGNEIEFFFRRDEKVLNPEGIGTLPPGREWGRRMNFTWVLTFKFVQTRLRDVTSLFFWRSSTRRNWIQTHLVVTRTFDKVPFQLKWRSTVIFKYTK